MSVALSCLSLTLITKALGNKLGVGGKGREAVIKFGK